MYQEMLDFVKSNPVGVLAVEMLDGSPHAATLHCAHTEEPLEFVFLTSRTYKKFQPILEKDVVRAAFVLGTHTDDTKTLQLTGELQLTANASHKDLYLKKFPDKAEKFGGPDEVFLVFTPAWWRYTDWSKPEGKTALTSDGDVIVMK